jgi:polyferredoxin
MKRLLIQAAFALLQNPFLANFVRGRIHQGESKRFCTPGLNCYSCPAAVTSCPLGAAQLYFSGASGATKHSISLFVTGFLLIIGAIFGRYICGYVCPFGLMQDLLYRIRSRKMKWRRFFRLARYAKYVLLALFVVILPYVIRCELSGLGSPWFCKYVCPAGTVFGALPLLSAHESLRELLGWQFVLKAGIALAVIVLSVFVWRIFCRVLCPLGAFYGLFNRVALLRLHCDKAKCSSCGKCRNACRALLDPAVAPNSHECMRCRDCVGVCRPGALK